MLGFAVCSSTERRSKMSTTLRRLNLSSGAFDEGNAIVVAGHLVDIGTRVIGWDDQNGFNGYTRKTVVFKEEDRRTGKVVSKRIKGPRYSRRKGRLGRPLGNGVSGLRGIRQFFIHHSGGDGRDPSNMYQTLYNRRKLSVQHATEDDGRVYQFNDVVDCCWHAGKHNGISTGCEACLYPLADRKPDYYSEERRRRTGNLPHRVVEDIIHGKKMRVFAFTDPQIEALARLAAGTWAALGILCPPRKTKVGGVPLDDFFKSPPVFPRGRYGDIPRTVVANAREHVGLIGHLQCTRRKIDPAGFPWELFESVVADRFREFVDNVGS
jgi:hypothetical protein